MGSPKYGVTRKNIPGYYTLNRLIRYIYHSNKLIMMCCSMFVGHLGMYEDWCQTFDPDQYKGEISELLVNVPEIRALYAKLVCMFTL